jgi:hypothetical protein
VNKKSNVITEQNKKLLTFEDEEAEVEADEEDETGSLVDLLKMM